MKPTRNQIETMTGLRVRNESDLFVGVVDRWSIYSRLLPK